MRKINILLVVFLALFMLLNYLIAAGPSVYSYKAQGVYSMVIENQNTRKDLFLNFPEYDKTWAMYYASRGGSEKFAKEGDEFQVQVGWNSDKDRFILSNKVVYDKEIKFEDERLPGKKLVVTFKSIGNGKAQVTFK